MKQYILYILMTVLIGFHGTITKGDSDSADESMLRGSGPRHHFCLQNPDSEGCAEIKAKHDARCAQNPERCAQMKARHEKRREMRKACRSNPETEQCQEFRSQRESSGQRSSGKRLRRGRRQQGQ